MTLLLEKPRLRASARSADAERSAPAGDGAFVSPNIAIQESCREESIFTQDQQAIIECVESRPWAYSNESAGRGYFNPSKRRGKKIQESWAVRLRPLMSHIDEIRVVYAVHEAGHAVVTVALGVILEQVTINSPEGGGYSRPDFFMYERVASNDLDFMPKKELRQIIEKRIVMAMTGRIAELWQSLR